MFRRLVRTSPAGSRFLPRAATVGCVGTLACAGACSTGSDNEADALSEGAAKTLFAVSPPEWFEAYFMTLAVSPDGGRAMFRERLVDLASGREVPVGGALEAVFQGTFDGAGLPVVRGRGPDGESAWFRIGDPGASAEPLGHVVGRWPTWSRSGELIASVVPGGGDDLRIRIGPSDGSAEPTFHPLPGPPAAVAWATGDSSLLVLVREEDGLGSLYALDAGTGSTRAIAHELDIPSFGAQIGVPDDGRVVYLPLASEGIPDPVTRHEPDADRDLDIYEVDLTSASVRPVVRTPAEEMTPVVAGGDLHWASIETRSEVVIVPVDGGEARLVASDVQGPTWRPDGRAIGVTTGDWRLADWALNLDAGVVEIDAEGRPTSDVTPIVTGYHEDFSPAWSPDGTWIAYHSHRSDAPVAGYEAEGSTDDVFLRRPDAPTSEETRLTDFGWEMGTPDWAPDGRRLLVDSWDRENRPGSRGASTWIVELDPETGAYEGRSDVPIPDEAPGIPVWGAWSPTREEIAHTYAVPGSTEVELWVLTPDGATARRVVGFTGNRLGGVDWTADGDALVYPAIVDGRQQLFRIPRTGGEPRQLTDDAASLFHPQVSPDGRWIAATRILHTKRILRRPAP